MTDLRTKVDALDTYPCLVTSTTEPDETPTALLAMHALRLRGPNSVRKQTKLHLI